MVSNNLLCRDLQTILYEEENCLAVQLPGFVLISLHREKSRLSNITQWILLIFTLFTSLQNLAQDTLVLRDGSKRLVKEITITETQLKFRDFLETDTSVHVISKADCQKIVYQDGKILDFKHYWLPEPAGHEKSVTYPTDYGRNFISLNVLDLFYRSLTINYEYLSRQGNLSIKCPLSIGFVALGLSENKLYSEDDWQAYHHPNKYFSIGIELFYYPGKFRNVRFFAGPGFEYGQYEDYYNYDIFDHHKSTFISFLAQTGAIFQLSEHLAMAGSLGFGYSTSGNYDGFPFNALRFGIALGYKF